MGGPGRMWVGAHLGAGPALGMVFSFFGALGFWREFAGTKQNKWLPAIGLALAVCTLAIGFYSHKPLQVLLPICAGALSFYIMRKLGTYARKTLPPTFRSVKTHLLCGLSSAPCAILVIIAIVLRVIHPVTSIEDPPTVSMAYMSILSCFLALSTLAPTYVCTRVARSSSVASCMALNALFSAPLLCALFATALITTLTNVDPGNLFNTGTFALSIWGAWLSALAVVAGGTYLGAKRNAGVERRKLKRAGG
jgi:hypothetical protein